MLTDTDDVIMVPHLDSFNQDLLYCPSTVSTMVEPQSSVRPWAVEHLSSQDLTMTDITDPQGLSQFPFGGNEHSQSGSMLWSLDIPPSRAAGPPTSSTITSEAGPHAAAEDDIRTVGSPLIQQASARRRKKDGTHQCPYCNSTFTSSQNLQYHINVHLGLKPYICTECSFATAYPPTLRKHIQKRHPKL
ncbi:hypothetical protein JOM56_014048 [Amanita muscaria]